MTEIAKIAAYVPISRQMLLEHGVIEPTEDERREAGAQRARQSAVTLTERVRLTIQRP